MLRITSLIAVLASFLAGCSITQTVKPVERFEGNQVCIVVNPAVSQQGFLQTYSRVLAEKGYTVRQLMAGTPVTECPVSSTYTANWRWDLGLYMAYADIQVFKNGQQSGQAVYDSRSGGANMGKFIKGEEKITELVNQLFPGRASSAVSSGSQTSAPSSTQGGSDSRTAQYACGATLDPTARQFGPFASAVVLTRQGAALSGQLDNEQTQESFSGQVAGTGQVTMLISGRWKAEPRSWTARLEGPVSAPETVLRGGMFAPTGVRLRECTLTLAL